MALPRSFILPYLVFRVNHFFEEVTMRTVDWFGRWREYGSLAYTVEIEFSRQEVAEKAARWLRRRRTGAARRGNSVFVRPGNRRMADDVMLAIGVVGDVRFHPLTYWPP